jgi:hypothetical protein
MNLVVASPLPLVVSSKLELGQLRLVSHSPNGVFLLIDIHPINEGVFLDGLIGHDDFPFFM